MKRLLISVTPLLFLAFSNNSIAQAKTKVVKKATTMDKGKPYKATSSNFAIGKAAYAKMVLELWKDFDDNNFDRHDYMADSINMMFPNGMVIKGKEANLDSVKRYRGGFTSVKSTIYACIPLTNTANHDNAVCIWGQSEETSTDGKVEKTDLHEVWWFNKDGKVRMMRQWAAKFGE